MPLILTWKRIPLIGVPFGDDEADVHKVDSRSVNGVEQAREVSIINESGLYHLVLMSKKPEAKKFRKGVIGLLCSVVS